MVAVGKDIAPALHHPVQPTGESDREPLNAPRELLRRFRLDDQVQVVALHREMHECESVALLPSRERARNGPEASPAPQVPYFLPHSQRDVHRMVPR